MRRWITCWCAAAALFSGITAAQSPEWHFPEKVHAGSQFSVPTSGSGSASLYIAGPGAVLRREVALGEPVAFSADDLHTAGHYIAILRAGASIESSQFDVIAAPEPASLSFLAKPSRLPVNLPNSISGVAYLFDTFGNLIVQPVPVTFELSRAADREQSHTVNSQNGVAWVKMNSATKAGPARLVAATAKVREQRVIQQVAGDPCTIHMTARGSSDQQTVLETEPVRDCGGNPVPDGTIVTFTEAYNGHQVAAVDAPLKRGVARTELPVHQGAVISVASGVVMGNEIRWGGR